MLIFGIIVILIAIILLSLVMLHNDYDSKSPAYLICQIILFFPLVFLTLEVGQRIESYRRFTNTYPQHETFLSEGVAGSKEIVTKSIFEPKKN